MDKTPDVAQLSVCCGKRLVWNSTANEGGEVDGWGGRCPGCGTEWAELATPARILLSTEQMLLARIAALEQAQRWRVTAEEMPPVGVEVLGCYGDGCQIVSRSVAKPSRWLAQDAGTTDQPDRWQPLPGVPELSQGADVPKEA